MQVQLHRTEQEVVLVIMVMIIITICNTIYSNTKLSLDCYTIWYELSMITLGKISTD